MDKRDRVICAIEHREADIVPYYADFTGSELKKMIRYTGKPDFQNSFGSHIVWAAATDVRKTDPQDPAYQYDEFGVRWRVDDNDIGVTDYCPLEDLSLEEYHFPDPDTDAVARAVKKINEAGDSFRMLNVGFTLYERAWSLRGTANLLMDMMEEEDFVLKLMDRITEYNLAVMETAMSMGDFDAFYFGDDWGQQRGLIMGKPLWKHYIQPGIQRVFDYATQCKKYKVFHSCGDISQLLPDLVSMGLDVYETFQPEIYDIAKTKQEVGANLTFLGGISTQTLLAKGTPEQVTKTVRETMEIMSVGGGYIAAPTHAVPKDVPCENVMAMLDVFQGQTSK